MKEKKIVGLDWERAGESLGYLGIDTSPEEVKSSLEEVIAKWEHLVCGALREVIHFSDTTNWVSGVVSKEERDRLEEMINMVSCLEDMRENALKQE
jgi:hypothetical protein